MALSLKIFDVSHNVRAKEYVLRELAAGNSLSKRVCKEVDLSRGRLFVGLPNGVDLATLDDFDWGGLRVGPVTYKEYLARIAAAFIADPGHFVLIQDTFTLGDDLPTSGYRYQAYGIAYGNEVYWLLTNPEISDDDLLAVICSGSPYPYAVFFCSAGTPSGKLKINELGLDEIVPTITGIAVGAFDEDSFLLWWSADSPTPFTIESHCDRG
jgi:hypothetical protein